MKNGKPMAMSYKTPEAVKYQKDFKEYVIQEVKKQGYNLKPDPLQHFYIDAVWVDDNVTCERVQRIYYDSENPRIELTIRPVNYIGVFDDAPQLEEFKSRCIGCKRYKRNCSLLKKAIEGRIQPEIHDGECDKYTPDVKEKKELQRLQLKNLQLNITTEQMKI